MSLFLKMFHLQYNISWTCSLQCSIVVFLLLSCNRNLGQDKFLLQIIKIPSSHRNWQSKDEEERQDQQWPSMGTRVRDSPRFNIRLYHLLCDLDKLMNLSNFHFPSGSNKDNRRTSLEGWCEDQRSAYWDAQCLASWRAVPLRVMWKPPPCALSPTHGFI